MAKKQLRPASAADAFMETTGQSIEELEANGQQQLIHDEKNMNDGKGKKDEEKVQPQIGQPRKYDEPTKHVSFSLPVSVIENLKILAGIERTNQTQIILKLIKKEIEMKSDKIESYKKLFE